MPRIKINTSLFEPLEIVVGDAIYTTVPFTEALVKKITAIQEQVKEGALDAMGAIIAQAAVVFARPAEEFTQMDVRLLGKLIQSATAEMTPKKDDSVKNALAPSPMPEGELSH